MIRGSLISRARANIASLNAFHRKCVNLLTVRSADICVSQFHFNEWNRKKLELTRHFIISGNNGIYSVFWIRKFAYGRRAKT